jgi:hypothetical protein
MNKKEGLKKYIHIFLHMLSSNWSDGETFSEVVLPNYERTPRGQACGLLHALPEVRVRENASENPLT